MAAEDILRFLHVLDEHAASRLVKPFPVHLCGASAVILAYGSTGATKDVDAIAAGPDVEIGELASWAGKASKIREQTGYYFEVVGVDFPCAAGWRRRARMVAGQFQVLQVHVLSPEDLIITKLKRFHAGDREDISLLTRDPSFDSARLLELYTDARWKYLRDETLEILDTNFNEIRTRMLGLSAIDWSADY